MPSLKSRGLSAALLTAMLVCVVPPGISAAAEKGGHEDTTAAAKSVAIEVARLRLGANPTPSGTAALIEAQEALRRYQLAPKDRKTEAQAVLDAAVAHLQTESEALSTGR